MSSKINKTGSLETARAAKGFSRRLLLQAAALGGTAACLSAGLVRTGLSASGQLNILMWSDYLPKVFLDAFTGATGIEVNHTPVGSNEEIIAIMTESRGQGFDLCSPTNMRSPQWVDLELLQSFDLVRLANLGNVNPAMLRIGEEEWNFGNKGVHWLPHIWGTESIAWRTDLWSPEGPAPTYGDVWSPETKGMTMGRPHSMMLGAGLYLETIGELRPGEMRRAYEDEEIMRGIWEQVTAWCVGRKDHIKLFWNDAETQKQALMEGGVTVGQTWDGPPLALKSAGEPVTYQAAQEGALAWVDGLALSAAAEQRDEVYAFIDFCYQPEPAGRAIDEHNYNSAVLGANKFASETYRKNFAEAYPGDALSNLWPWPQEPQWYADVRTEFRDRFMAA